MSELKPYLKTEDILNRFQFSVSTLERRINRENNPFPKPVTQNGKGTHRLWKASDVEKWEFIEFEKC